MFVNTHGRGRDSDGGGATGSNRGSDLSSGSGSSRGKPRSTRKTTLHRGVPGAALCRTTTPPATRNPEHNAEGGPEGRSRREPLPCPPEGRR